MSWRQGANLAIFAEGLGFRVQDDVAAKALDCHLILWSMSESVLRCVNIEDTPFKEM